MLVPSLFLSPISVLELLQDDVTVLLSFASLPARRLKASSSSCFRVTENHGEQDPLSHFMLGTAAHSFSQSVNELYSKIVLRSQFPSRGRVGCATHSVLCRQMCVIPPSQQFPVFSRLQRNAYKAKYNRSTVGHEHLGEKKQAGK